MTSGTSYARQIDEAISSLDRELSGKTARYNELTQQQTATRTRIADAFAQIARIQVDAIGAAEIAGNDALSQEAERVLRRREADHASLKASLTTLEAALQQHLADEREAQEARDAAAAGVARICADVDADLARQDEHSSLAAAAEDSRAKASAAAAKANNAVAEREAKRHAYEDDPIFAYLRRCGFGTSSYRPWPVVRAIDGWLASLCGFASASRAYDALIELPDYLSKHATTMADAAAVAAQRSSSSRRAALEAAGIVAAERDLDDKDAALARADEVVEACRSHIRNTIDAVERIERWRDRDGQELLSRMSSAFGADSLAEMHRRVAATGVKEDDRLLQEIVSLRNQSSQLETQANAADLDIKQLKRRRERLTNVRSTFRSKYNSSDYRIGSSASDLLTGYVLGSVVADDLWRGIERSASYDPPSSSSSSSSASFGGFSSGGGFGGGGSGFSTGGGF